jgi:hypothetical protein
VVVVVSLLLLVDRAVVVVLRVGMVEPPALLGKAIQVVPGQTAEELKTLVEAVAEPVLLVTTEVATQVALEAQELHPLFLAHRLLMLVAAAADMIYALAAPLALVALEVEVLAVAAALTAQLILAAEAALVTEVCPPLTAQTAAQELSSLATQEHSAALAARSHHLVATLFIHSQLQGHIQHESFC